MTLESKSTSSTKKKKSNNFDIYLASSSPRRAEILKNLKVNFEILKCDFDESNFTDESPEDFVIKNTQQKCLAAHAIRQQKKLPVSSKRNEIIAQTFRLDIISKYDQSQCRCKCANRKNKIHFGI